MRKTLTEAVFKDPKIQSLGINIFSGAASGILGAAAGSPFFLVKTRLQSYSPFLPVGTQHNYKNAADGLSQIYRNEGIGGLYRGVGAAMVRTGFGSSVQLPTYFFAKRRLQHHLGMQDGLALHLASSTVSGFAVCTAMHPPGKLSFSFFAQLRAFKHSLSPPILPVPKPSSNTLRAPQILSWPVCTTRPEICTTASLTVSGRPSKQRVSSPSTRGISPTWPESYLIP